MRTYCRCLRVCIRCRLRLSQFRHRGVLAVYRDRRSPTRRDGTDSDLYNEAYYGGGLYGGGFWGWWRKGMAGHNFSGERRETDWMAEVLANSFNDSAAYGARGSIFMRQLQRVHQGVPAAYRHPALFALGCACPGP